MYKEIIVNVTEDETRVGVLEDKQLVEILIERSQNQRLVGNVYKGKVENVLPGMQAAFVNIGLEKNAFLYVEEAVPARNDHPHGVGHNIVDVLKPGQDIIVQIIKEPIGSKGPRITTHITLPGRYLVLMPTVDYVGISRRIEDEEERERLKEIATKAKPEGMGVIVRTVAEGMDEEEIKHDMHVMSKLWQKIDSKSTRGTVPNLLHRDLELVQRILRDAFTEDVDRLIIDSRDTYEKVNELLDIIDPKLKIKVAYEERENIFEDYGIETELNKALKRRVWLKCGAYLVIDQAEALTVIDVNTGKYVGNTTNLEDTVLKTNLAAALEIARQVRLRNIGGIVIIDFIDMMEEEHRNQVIKTLDDALKKDKTKGNVLGITQLGLIEMTRKKVRPSLNEVMQKPCSYCEGRGKVLSEETVAINLKSEIYQLAKRTTAETILVEANPLVAARLIGSGGAILKELEQVTGKNLFVRGYDNYHIEEVNVKPLHDQEEVAATIPVQTGEIIQVPVKETHVSNSNDGISRLNGYILDIEGAGALVGKTVSVEIDKVFRTYAKAKLVE